MSGRWVAVAGALALVVLGTGGCDRAAKKPSTEPVSQSVQQCQQQWHDVSDSVLGLDQDPDPSALASRWTTVIATIDYYETSTAAADCEQRIENQVNAIAALRQFGDRLRPYDMTYQVRQVEAAVELYLHDAVPKPVAQPDGTLAKAPTHHAVERAMTALRGEASAANAELLPGWEHLASVSLDDEAAVTAALDDLDALARAGTHWTACQRALQVIVAATRAQEGLLGTPEDQPSGGASPEVPPAG